MDKPRNGKVDELGGRYHVPIPEPRFVHGVLASLANNGESLKVRLMVTRSTYTIRKSVIVKLSPPSVEFDGRVIGGCEWEFWKRDRVPGMAPMSIEVTAPFVLEILFHGPLIRHAE